MHSQNDFNFFLEELEKNYPEKILVLGDFFFLKESLWNFITGSHTYITPDNFEPIKFITYVTTIRKIISSDNF